MKKLYIIAVFALLTGNLSYSQILTASHATLDYTGPCNISLTALVDISNNGTDTLHVLCERYSRNMNPAHRSYFCWVVCYDTTTNLSPSPKIVAPGGMITSFEGWCAPYNTPGQDTVEYRYYDKDGYSDTLYLTYTYDFVSVGINEIPFSKYSLNITGPNPANNSTVINYTLPGQKDAKLIVTNLLGSKVNEITLNNRTNSMVIPLADLKSGVYIYSLVIDGVITSSKKLIVSHQ